MFSPDFLANMKKLEFHTDLSAEQEKFLKEANAEFSAKELLLEKEYRFNEYKEWNFNQDSGLLHLFFENGSGVEAKAQIIASYSLDGKVWEWAWNNPHIDKSSQEASEKVKQLGELIGVHYLTEGMLTLPSDLFVTFLSAISVKAVDAKGVFKATTDGFDIFLAMTEIRCLSEEESNAIKAECEAMAESIGDMGVEEQTNEAPEPFKSADEFVNEVIEAFKSNNLPLNQPAPFNLYLSVNSEKDGVSAGSEVEKLGLNVDLIPNGDTFLVMAQGQIVPAPLNLTAIGKVFIDQAEKFDGEFAGWEVNPDSAVQAMEDMLAGLMANMGIDLPDLSDLD